MRRDGTTALLLGATLGVVGIAMHVTAEAARPTTERLLAGAMSLTPVGYAVWKIGGGSLIALGVLVGARGLFRYRRDARYVQRVEALIGSRDLETEAVNHDQDELASLARKAEQLGKRSGLPTVRRVGIEQEDRGVR